MLNGLRSRWLWRSLRSQTCGYTQTHRQTHRQTRRQTHRQTHRHMRTTLWATMVFLPRTVRASRNWNPFQRDNPNGSCRSLLWNYNLLPKCQFSACGGLVLPDKHQLLSSHSHYKSEKASKRGKSQFTTHCWTARFSDHNLPPHWICSLFKLQFTAHCWICSLFKITIIYLSLLDLLAFTNTIYHLLDLLAFQIIIYRSLLICSLFKS